MFLVVCLASPRTCDGVPDGGICSDGVGQAMFAVDFIVQCRNTRQDANTGFERSGQKQSSDPALRRTGRGFIVLVLGQKAISCTEPRSYINKTP